MCTCLSGPVINVHRKPVAMKREKIIILSPGYILETRDNVYYMLWVLFQIRLHYILMRQLPQAISASNDSEYIFPKLSAVPK